MKRRTNHSKYRLCAADGLRQCGHHCSQSCGGRIGAFVRNMRCILTVSAAVLLLSACGGEKTQTAVRQANAQTGVADVLAAGSAQDGSADSFAAGSVNPAHLAAQEDLTPEKIEKALSGTAGVDVDLTQLSSVMVFSEVYNIMVLPQDYMGKTIRMEGITAIYTDEATGQKYYSCIVQDATACCAQGIEFRLKDINGKPAAYPEEGEMITVTGVFDVYAENGYQYALLTDAALE